MNIILWKDFIEKLENSYAIETEIVDNRGGVLWHNRNVRLDWYRNPKMEAIVILNGSEDWRLNAFQRDNHIIEFEETTGIYTLMSTEVVVEEMEETDDEGYTQYKDTGKTKLVPNKVRLFKISN